MNTDVQCLIVLVTSPSMDVAKQISLHLINNNLAACVNLIHGVTSIYEWNGKIVEDNEVLLIIKTTSERYKDLQTSVLSLHPYEIPEIVAYPITQGSSSYLDWVRSRTTRPKP